ncbi:MAG: hypothetical protein CSA89_00660 [Bacteroidales bacterium]|nr:MAG: hypothetical protein CSA89_00660 [Bacteroidales bacterium]
MYLYTNIWAYKNKSLPKSMIIKKVYKLNIPILIFLLIFSSLVAKAQCPKFDVSKAKILQTLSKIYNF